MSSTLSMKDVHDLIKQVRSDPRINNKPVLAINVAMAQQAKNNGFPVHMYHQTLDPILVLNAEEREALEGVGYGTNYIPKSYPKALYRRNMDPKFEADGFIESRTVATAEKEQELRKMRKPAGAGEWAHKITEIEELPDAPTEDPAVTIARLKGQIAGLQQADPEEAPTKGKK
jgi:hypothetical protein